MKDNLFLNNLILNEIEEPLEDSKFINVDKNLPISLV